LQLMRERGISNVYVVDRHKRLIGAVTAEKASQAASEGWPLDGIIDRNVETVRPDTLLNELFEKVSNVRIPLAVTDDGGKLLGIVIRGSVLAALAGTREKEGDGP